MKALLKSLLAAAVAVSVTAGAVSAAPISRAPQDNLFFATSTEPLGIDPALADDMDSANMNINIYESLLRFKKGTVEVEPALAESWTISDDGLVYTFNLRKGVKFHDGTPFNAEAVKFNFDRQSPENRVEKMSYAPLVLDGIAKTEVVDEYTLRITLKKPLTPFLNLMAMTFAAPIASPTALKKYNNSLMQNPVGTGPYRFVAWDRGQQIVLTRNDEYWGEKAPVQNVIYRIMKETSARVVALKNGEVDIINGIDGNVIEEIKASGGEIFTVEGNNTNYMVYNFRKGYVTEDVAVRKAISQAINVPELVQTLYKGYADYAPSYMPSWMPGFDKNLVSSTYDPEASKKFFKEKGITKLTAMTYSNARFYNTVGGQVLAEAVQSYLDKVGVKLDIVVYDWGTYRAKLLTDNWDIAFIGWGGDNGDADNYISIFSTDDPVSNQGLYKNEKFNELIAKAVTTPNGEARNKLYQQAQKILVEDYGILPISHSKEMVAHSKNVSGNFLLLNMTRFSDLNKTVSKE